MILSEFIAPDVMVARSVNLERDMGDEVPLRHYYLTGKGLQILSRLAAATGNGCRSRVNEGVDPPYFRQSLVWTSGASSTHPSNTFPDI